MKTACIYHSIDLDGWMSAAIVKHWFNQQEVPNKEGEDCNTIDFIGYNYGQPIPDLSEYDKVIMVDISFLEEEMYKLCITKDFIWNDHHASALAMYENIRPSLPNDIYYAKGLRGVQYAACELTWQYFFPNETMPEIVRLLGRYDCFGHKTKSFEMSSDGYDKAKQYLKEVGKLKEFEDNKTSTDGYSLVHYANDVAKLLSEEQKVLEFQYGARQCISNYEEAYNYLINNIEIGEVNTNAIWSQGSSIYQYLCTEAKQVYKHGFEVIFYEPLDTNVILQDGYRKFICINKERFNPINFGIDYHKEGYEGCACFHYDGVRQLWAFSLYNDNGLVDCSEIAKQYGGGGHKGAAGFTISDVNKIINPNIDRF